MRMPWHPVEPDRFAAATLTYPEVGATRNDVLPAGYHHVERREPVGEGPAAFERAARAVLTWQMHRGAGLRVAASTPTVDPDVVVVAALGWPPFGLTVPCRVIYVVDTELCRGFGYGTLPGHPEHGEEAFLVELAGDGRVYLTIRAFSRPATLLSRLGGPVGRQVQRLITDRYIRAVRRAATDHPDLFTA